VRSSRRSRKLLALYGRRNWIGTSYLLRRCKLAYFAEGKKLEQDGNGVGVIFSLIKVKPYLPLFSNINDFFEIYLDRFNELIQTSNSTTSIY